MDIEFLDWDSRFFGYPVEVARLSDLSALERDFRQTRQQALELGLRLLYIETPFLDNHQRQTCQTAGVTAVSINVGYVKTVVTDMPCAPSSVIQPCREYHPALRALVLQSGSYSRFRRDPGFRNREFERLYDEWLAASLRGDDGKIVLVVGPSSLPRGLITLEPGAKVRIGLLAVDARWRGRGIGRSLVAEAERHCGLRSRNELEVATQKANQEACRFYERCGFHCVFEKEIFHAWFPPSDTSKASP